MAGTLSHFPEVEILRKAWTKAPPPPDLRTILPTEVLSDAGRLRELIHLDALERRRVSEPAGLEHYQSLLADRAPEALAPGTELARLLIRLELLMAGDAAGVDRIESLRARLGEAYAADVSIAWRGAAPSMASPLHTRTDDGDEITTLDESGILATASLPRGERLGDWIGPYRLLDVIGEGGFGIVYHAQQREPIERPVALKLIKPGMDTKSVLARFEAERQTLALLRHDHIAAIYDAGATERGRPYFVMELVRGETITRYCDRHRLTTRERLELFIPVCRAVHHAHQKGIIHRDLSPDNILVEVRDGKPVPKIIDFGVAKAIDRRMTERTLSIERGVMIGKPEYMSPEQAEMTTLDIDTTADIYSLGVVLYEMLAGVLPLDRRTLRARGLDAMIAQIRYSESPTPQTRLSSLDAQAAQEIAFFRQAELRALAAELDGRLHYLPMKALRPDRTRRFSSAEAYARDIERYLKDENFIEAGREPLRDRMWRYVKRNRAPVAATAMVLIAAVLGMAGTAWQAGVAAHERDAARTEARRAEHALQFLTDTLTSARPDVEGRDFTVAEAMRQAFENASAIETVEPELAADVFRTAGATFLSLRLHAEAEAALDRAARLCRSLYGERDRRTLSAGVLRAGALIDLSRYDEAESILSTACADTEREFGKGDWDTTFATISLARLYMTRGEFDHAADLMEPLVPQALAKGMNDDNVRSMLHNVALGWSAMGRAAEARDLLRTLIADHERMGEERRAELALTLHTYAGVLYDLDALNAAREAYERSLDLCRELFGDRSDYILMVRNSLGNCLRKLNDLEGAARVTQEAWDTALETLGIDHHVSLDAAYNLAVIYLELGREDDSLRLLRLTLPIRKEVFGEAEPTTVRAAALLERLEARVGDGGLESPDEDEGG